MRLWDKLSERAQNALMTVLVLAVIVYAIWSGA